MPDAKPVKVLDSFPFQLDASELIARVHLQPGSEDARDFEDLLFRATEVARPKAMFRECYIEDRTADTLTVENVNFRSPFLVNAVGEANRVFAFIATCGAELDKLKIEKGDYLEQFWLDEIKAVLLSFSIKHLAGRIDEKFSLTKASAMSPGSGDVDVWPIEQQKELFSLFGNAENLIGVRLTESFLMMPNKSVSGLRFASEIDFQSCRLCHRVRCPGRRAPFDPEMWDAIEHG